MLRAHGGCLGTSSRRRAWQAAKSFGEAQAAFDPEMPEWGNLLGEVQASCNRREPGEVKHLSSRRRRNQTRFPE